MDLDPETQAIANVILPFVSREKIRGITKEQTENHLTELISQIIIKVYGDKFD